MRAKEMNKDSLWAGLRLVSVATLFGLCGAWSSSVLLPNFPSHGDVLFPLPFAALCTLLFMRTLEAILAIPLMDMVWLTSLFAAVYLGISTDNHIEPGCIGGLIGGVGLVICAAICYRSLFSLKCFLIGALLGSLAGISFLPWTQAFTSDLNRGTGHAPMGAFAIWEAAMGTYLYVLCSQAKRRYTHFAEMETEALSTIRREPDQQ